MIKARIARELSDNEIFLCEVLMENVLDDLEPIELAAVLSVFTLYLKPVRPFQDFLFNFMLLCIYIYIYKCCFVIHLIFIVI